MNIRTQRELKAAYESLYIWQELLQGGGKPENEARAQERIRQLKRDIRKYHRENTEQGEYIIGGDWDCCIKVIPMPQDWTRDDAEEYFQAREFIAAPRSMYDCTGKLFTAWHSIKRRAGRWYIYHCICADV